MFASAQMSPLRPVSAHRQFVIRVRWGFGLLCLVIALLLVALVMGSRDSSEESSVATANATIAPPPPPAPVVEVPKIAILVANQPLHVGDQLSAALFERREVPRDLVPTGVLVEKDAAQLEGRYAKADIAPAVMVSSNDIAEERPVTPLHIPAGMRAVTILADRQTGVEGYARPGSLVDVLWVYQERGEAEKSIATIVRFARILSVAGDSHNADRGGDRNGQKLDSDSRIPVTVLATEKDAKIIQLAAASGTITLSLVGADERVSDNLNMDTQALSQLDVLHRDRDRDLVPPKCSVKDPGTGKEQVFLLRDRHWGKMEDIMKNFPH